jgi:hypothetical protein
MSVRARDPQVEVPVSNPDTNKALNPVMCGYGCGRELPSGRWWSTDWALDMVMDRAAPGGVVIRYICPSCEDLEHDEPRWEGSD